MLEDFLQQDEWVLNIFPGTREQSDLFMVEKSNHAMKYKSLCQEASELQIIGVCNME